MFLFVPPENGTFYCIVVPDPDRPSKYRLASLINCFKHAFGVVAFPAEPNVTKDKIVWYKTQITRIHGILCMIGKHPVIIVFEVEEVGFPSIQEEFIIPEY